MSYHRTGVLWLFVGLGKRFLSQHFLVHIFFWLALSLQFFTEFHNFLIDDLQLKYNNQKNVHSWVVHDYTGFCVKGKKFQVNKRPMDHIALASNNAKQHYQNLPKSMAFVTLLSSQTLDFFYEWQTKYILGCHVYIVSVWYELTLAANFWTQGCGIKKSNFWI